MFFVSSLRLLGSARENTGKILGSIRGRVRHSIVRILAMAIGTIAVPQLSTAQGTVDPATVPLRELIREPGTAAARPKFVRVDSNGNIFVGTVSSTTTSSGFNSSTVNSSVVRKYSPPGNTALVAQPQSHVGHYWESGSHHLL
jgi:hypothetical protein